MVAPPLTRPDLADPDRQDPAGGSVGYADAVLPGEQQAAFARSSHRTPAKHIWLHQDASRTEALFRLCTPRKTWLHQMPALHQNRPKKQAGEAGGLARKSGLRNLDPPPAAPDRR